MRSKWVKIQKKASMRSQHKLNTGNVWGCHYDYHHARRQTKSPSHVFWNFSSPERNKPLHCIQQTPTHVPWCPLVPNFPQPDSHPLSSPCNYLLQLTRVTFCFFQLKSPSWCNTPTPLFLVHSISRHIENLSSVSCHATNWDWKCNQDEKKNVST